MTIAKQLGKIRRRLRRYDVRHRIVSIGGVGSSSLVAHLEQGDADRIWYHSRHKHCVHPDLLPGADGTRGMRACFVFGDPYAIVLSVFRRGLQRRHEQAMSRGIPGYRAVLEHDTDLQTYLDGGVDRFFLGEHLDNWLGYQGKNVQVLAVRYGALGQHIGEMLRFLRCSRPFHVRPRTRRSRQPPPQVLRGLDALYGDLRQRIEALPSLIRVNYEETPD